MPSAELAVARVKLRVSAGGHDIPEETIRRRYDAGLRNLYETYASLADGWQVIDSSRHAPLVKERHSNEGLDSALFTDTELTERNLRTAVQKALREHKAAGRAVPAWENGTITWITPDNIEP